MTKKAEIFDRIEEITNVLPIPIYWMDTNGVMLGTNKYFIDTVGIPYDFYPIGKTAYDAYPKEIADKIVQHNNKVMQTGKILSQEEPILDVAIGKKNKYLISIKAPIYEENGNTIGLIGVSIDIAAEKETERLKNELQKVKLQEQLKFKKLVDQAVCDNQSPLTALLVIANQCSGLKKEIIFKTFENLITSLPINFFWVDRGNKFLGANKAAAAAFGLVSVERIIGKTAYEYFPREIADDMMKQSVKVVQTGKVLGQEEQVVDFATGKTKYFYTYKAPLYDDTGKIVGLACAANDITTEKNAERLVLENEKQKIELEELLKFKKLVDQAAEDTKSNLAILLVLIQQCIGLAKDKIFETIERFASVAPIGISWLDENNVVLGINKHRVKAIGGLSSAEFVGKTLYNFYPFEIADDMVKHNNSVMQSGKILSYEEQIKDVTTGEIKYFAEFKAPLYENNGKIVGTIGASVDITAEKNAERLKAEYELQKAQLQEQLKFKKLVDQAANDVQSPLAILLILTQQCVGLTKDAVFETLERLADVAPVPVYWLDENNAVLGANKLDLEAIGSTLVAFGKTPYDLLPPKMADNMVKHNNLVMQSGKILSQEEQIRDFTTGRTKYFTEFKAPLYDNNGKLIGILGTAADITAQKETESLKLENEQQKIKLKKQESFKQLVDQVAKDTKSNLAILLVLVQQCTGLAKKEVFETIKRLADVTLINLYWVDENNILLGANKQDIESIGGTSVDDFIGKTPYDYLPFEIADSKVKHNNFVMQTGKILSREDTVRDLTTGEIKYFTAFKAPLYDKDGKNIGILCSSVDITTEKNAEHLKLENELQKAKIQEQERFRIIANQVAHDIRSPLASLQMIVISACKNLPEKERLALNSVAKSITDVANNLLNGYKKANAEAIAKTIELQPVLVSLTLSKIVSEKRHQYADSLVRINDSYEPKSSFVLIKTDPSNFERMISNLVNNAVEAFECEEDKKGKKDKKTRDNKIDLNLSLESEHIKITIQDNGKGMPKEVIDKVMNNIAVTIGKKDGNGIGLTQVRSTLQISKGKMLIESKIGFGTKITLTIPITETPDWMAKHIILHKGDTVVVLDDDPSIHGAWDMRFKEYEGIVHLKHFKSGEKAISFINSSNKGNLFLLSDFELINQELNGLQVIEQISMAAQSILVTSHYNKQGVRDIATKAGVRILPKQLASSVPIKIEENEENEKNKGTKRNKDPIADLKKIDLVIIDDNQIFADSLTHFFQDKIAVDTYYNPKRFLENLSKYEKDTKICIDHDFKDQINGIELAKQLHEAGYTKLYLLSGKDFAKGEVPSYLTVIMKGDMDALLQLAAVA